MSDRRERELADEIEFHRAMRERQYREQHGMSEKDAADKAKRDFGGFEKWKEVCRDVGRVRILDEFLRDLTLSVRMLRKSPVFTAVALVTLTLAIGANTAIFSLMNALMLKTLPVPDAQQMVLLTRPPDSFPYAFAYPLFKQIERQSGSVMSAFAFMRQPLRLSDGQSVSIVAGALVSGQYFSSLQVQPELGRWIGQADDRPGAPEGAAVVISDHFWRSRMNGDASALGRKLILNQAVFTVVGVMPDAFRGMGTDERADIFVPFELEPIVNAPFSMIKSGYNSWWFQVGARLRPSVSLQQARAFLKTHSSQFIEKRGPYHISAEPGAEGFSFLRLRFQEPLRILMALVSLVLLIACLNLATMLMARSASRRRDMTTRFALGASRGRLLRQLLTESLLLAVTGSLLGFALSPALTHALAAILALQHDSIGMTLDVAPDALVLLFTAAIAMGATALTGTLPALVSTGGGLQAGLHEGSATLRAAERRRLWPRVMMSMEVGMAFVLVTGATLLGYSLVLLHTAPSGFDPHGIAYLEMDLTNHSLKVSGIANAYREILERIRKLPGVTDASVVGTIPVTGRSIEEDMHVPGEAVHHFWRNSVGPTYFQTMRTRLLSGRDLRWTDGAPARKVIVNRSAARLLFPAGDELGRRVIFEDGKTEAEVVGVVEDAKYSNLRDAAPPTVYSAATVEDALNVVVRTSGSPKPIISEAIRVIQKVLPDIPSPAAFSMEQLISESLATERIMAILALFFGGLALLMTGIGLYGTLAYTTERRTGEIGIRLALGAMPRNVISMVCVENGAIALAGCVVGTGGSVFASKMIASFLYGVSAKDPVVFGLAALVLMSVAAAASLVPAVKASKIDPVSAIRYE